MISSETKEAIVIEVTGSLKGDKALNLGKEVNSIENSCEKDIVLDVSGVNDIDSRGLGTLVYLWKTIGNVKHSLVLLNPSATMERLLKETNLHKVFSIIKDIKDLKRA